MRIVIDTNVLLSGLLWLGTPHALLNQARAGTVELVTSRALLDELAEVIARPKFASILQRTSRTPERILSELHAPKTWGQVFHYNIYRTGEFTC